MVLQSPLGIYINISQSNQHKENLFDFSITLRFWFGFIAQFRENLQFAQFAMMIAPISQIIVPYRYGFYTYCHKGYDERQTAPLTEPICQPCKQNQGTWKTTKVSLNIEDDRLVLL